MEHLIASLEPDYPSLHLHGEVKPFWDQPHLSLGRLLITSDLSDSVYSMHLEKHEGRYEPCYTLTVDSEVGGLTTAPGRSCRQVEAFTVLLTSIAYAVECPTVRDALDACTEMETENLSDLQMARRMAARVEMRHRAELAQVSAPTASATESPRVYANSGPSTPLRPSAIYLFYAKMASPAEALVLGVFGTGPAANRRRLELAEQLSAEGHRLSEAAYAAATRPPEPEIPKPFGLELLRHHGGDVLNVVTSNEFCAAVERHLGSGWPEVFRVHEDWQLRECQQEGAIPFQQQFVDEAIRQVIAGVHRHATGLPASDDLQTPIAQLSIQDRPDQIDRAASFGLNR